MNIQSMLLKLAVNIIPVISVAYIIVGIKLLKQKVENRINYFSLFLFAAAIYSFGYYLELNCNSLESLLHIRNFEYLGVTFIPPLGALFIEGLTRTTKLKKVRWFLYTVSFVLWLLFITNPVHSLFYKSIQIFIGEFSAPITVRGPAYYALLLHYWMFLFFSTYAIQKAYKVENKSNKKKSLLFMLITFQIPWIAVSFILLGLDKYFDPTPISIFIVCSLFAYNEMKNNMFELQINKWEAMFIGIEEPAFLANKKGEVICANKNAKELFKEQEKTTSDIIHSLNDSDLESEPIFLTYKDTIRWFDVKKSEFDAKNNLISYMLLDITDKRNASLVTEAFFNAIEDFIFIGTEEGKILFVNQQVKKRLEYTDEDINQMRVYDFYPEELREEVEESFSKIMYQNQNNDCSLPLQSKSMNKILVATRVWLGEWNGNPVMYGMSKDISLLKETEDKFEKSFVYNPAAMAIKDLHTNEYIDVNNAFVNKFGYTKEKVIARTAQELGLYRNEKQAINMELGKFSDVEINVHTQNGDVLNGLFFGELIHTNHSTELLTVMLDITEIKSAHEKLRISEEQYRLLITQMQQGLAVHEIICDEKGKPVDYLFISVNKSFERLTGLHSKDIIGKTVLEVLPNTEEYWIETYGKVALTGKPYQYENYSVELDKYYSAWAYSPKEKQFAVIITDITEKKKYENEIEYLSYHDQLTGLHNRRYFDHAIINNNHLNEAPLAMIMVDVNGLKLTNDAFGHFAGDLLLKKVASILKMECNNEDILARIGGDEFILLLPKKNAKDTEKIIGRINKTIENEKVDNTILSVSIGYALKDDESESMDEVYKKAEDAMYKNKLSESSSMRSKTIDLIMNTLYEKNNREMLHSKRVSEVCEEIASKMNFEKDAFHQIRLAGLMHDIGKIGISEKILNKPGKLNSDEWKEIERHSEIGYRILSSVNEFSEIADYVLEHHEKWDGTGYPRGLKGEEISLQARIIAVADAFDAMTSHRAYRSALSEEKAINEIKKCAGIQFDPNIVKIFIEMISVKIRN